ncbi:hypothetical protein, partial [Acidianus sp. RZ1]|uniref:hypothetical protein n=1 Tax=Acidianus sp. RZ1 TaxID=1540082 RepID=UPI001491BE54
MLRVATKEIYSFLDKHGIDPVKVRRSSFTLSKRRVVEVLKDFVGWRRGKGYGRRWIVVGVLSSCVWCVSS